MDTKKLKISGINIDSLFGLYDHKIKLNNDGITIIHGQNGVGKTAILTLLSSLFNGNVGGLIKYPYKKFEIVFNNNSCMEISPSIEDIKNKKIIIKYDGESATIPINNSEINKHATRISRQSPFIDQISPTQWLDMRSGELMSALEVINKFGNINDIPFLMLNKFPKIKEIKESLNISFIKTQRLESNIVNSINWAPVKKISSLSIVSKYAEKMKEILNAALSNYGKVSQLLDQTFPNRLLQEDAPTFPLDELNIKMDNINNYRQKLKEIKILEGDDYSISYEKLNIDNLSDIHYKVLSTYVDDSEKKLSTLDELSKKVDLLLMKINTKFNHKKLSIDQNEGMILYDEQNNKIELDDLSSGEQHELVLMFDLLFNTRKNSLILIDEPEISLHISWQRKFLDDLIDIIKLTNVDVIIATHSPNIVEGHDDLMIELRS